MVINVDDNFEHFDIFNGFLKYGVFLPLYHFWINSTLSYTYKLQNGLFTLEMVYLHWKKMLEGSYYFKVCLGNTLVLFSSWVYVEFMDLYWSPQPLPLDNSIYFFTAWDINIAYLSINIIYHIYWYGNYHLGCTFSVCRFIVILRLADIFKNIANINVLLCICFERFVEL